MSDKITISTAKNIKIGQFILFDRNNNLATKDIDNTSRPMCVKEKIPAGDSYGLLVYHKDLLSAQRYQYYCLVVYANQVVLIFESDKLEDDI